MITLISEQVNFRISTTDIKVIYTERSGVKIIFDVLRLEDFEKKKYSSVELLFEIVAELKCVSLNFFELNCNQYEIFRLDERLNDFDFWKTSGYNPSSGFYQVDNSDWLKRTKSTYDPQGNLNLKHFIIEGYDSYIEILASKYSIV